MNQLRHQPIGLIVAQNLAAAAVFEAHDMDFCCHGKQTLAAACAARGVNVEKLEAELEALLTKQSEVEAVMADPETYAQRELFAKLSKEYGELSRDAEELLARMSVMEEEIADLEARRAALLEDA